MIHLNDVENRQNSPMGVEVKSGVTVGDNDGVPAGGRPSGVQAMPCALSMVVVTQI